MDSGEILREIERVETITNKNSDLKDVTGAMARGVWEVALQIALTREANGGR